MESPPSSTTWSEAFILSDDSGLLLTNGSVSSGSTDAPRTPIEDSDCEERSLSQYSLDAMSDIICGENFNTLKKTPLDHIPATSLSPIEPPLAFQDSPPPLPSFLHSFSFKMASVLLSHALEEYHSILVNKARWRRDQWCVGRYYGHDFAGYSSPISSGRPGSRSSLSSRLSSSHNSLYVPSARRVDDSSFITQAVSHDTLSTNQISDLYTVPFDSDVYAVPVDVVKDNRMIGLDERSSGGKKGVVHGKRKKRRDRDEGRGWRRGGGGIKADKYHWCLQKPSKRHSMACSAPSGVRPESEPIHMTLQEVRHYLQSLYSSSSDSSEQPHYNNNNNNKNHNHYYHARENNKPIAGSKPQKVVQITQQEKHSDEVGVVNNGTGRGKKGTFLISIKNKKVKDSCESKVEVVKEKRKKSPARFLSFKQTLCNMFRFRRFLSPERVKLETNEQGTMVGEEEGYHTIVGRALPPLPNGILETGKVEGEEPTTDFATSIQRVKDYGWYWGPLPSEVAEKILSNEPDGSFIVRDSSDDHYIFSLTFKLNNCVRHVRIDHDQGNFSFGSCTKFKSQTIVEFIENAVEHSRSGRYLFFLHRRPVIGPVRVQLLHPVSRFKQVQSLQHICRFAIHKVVRRDLIPSLPLPRRMIDYLNTPHYYSEHLVDVVETGEPPPCSAFRREEPDHPVPPLNYVILNETNPRQS